MTTPPHGESPPRRPFFFIIRHLRGWVVGTACLGALALIGRAAYVAVNLSSAGEFDSLAKDTSFWAGVVLVGFSLLAIRRRATSFEFRYGKLILRLGAPGEGGNPDNAATQDPPGGSKGKELPSDSSVKFKSNGNALKKSKNRR
ncbi:hypothetical protein [Microbacterium gorillae]|uniref:hypothetical protein n=1 Tax=Microbacterium gorillae TaxID=1231063 RepID=UPI003D99D448